VVYLQADYNGVRARLFEAYWAPATVMGTSAVSAFVWLMRQLLRPLAVLRAPWRSYARLRRAHLLTMVNLSLAYASRGRQADQDARSMVGIYRRFVEQRDGSSASFRKFLGFVENGRPEPERARLLALARRWHRYHVRIELVHLAWFVFVALSIASGLVLIALGVIGFLIWAGKLESVAWLFPASTLDGVVLFSSPWDNYGPRKTLAPWVTRGVGATPAERWYGAYHQKEQTADVIARAYSALGIPSAHVHVFTLEPAAANSANPYHPSVVGNGSTPRSPDGTPAYLDDWRAMLGDVH
jgi:hypothetical protein